MNEAFKWLAENVEWVFSGSGTYVVAGIVSLVVAVLGILIRRAWVRKHTQVIKGKSSGIQAGRDVNINAGRK